MLYNTELRIAIKDVENRYNSMDTSVFQLENFENHLPNFQLRITKPKEIDIDIKCPICGECHESKYSLSDLIRKQMIIGGCEVTGLPIYFIGKPIKVSKYINRYNEINNKIYAML